MPPILTVRGPSLLQELVYKNSLLGRTLDDVTPTSALATLLAGSTWTIGTVDGGLSNVSARFDGVPVFNAIAKLADILGVHVRELTGRRIDFGAFGVASGITLMAPSAIGPSVDDNANVGIIKSISLTEEGTSIVNRVIPVGAGEGNTLFQLGPSKGAAAGTPWSTRTSPYTIQHATGPNGETYYYLEDTASVAAYGRREKVLAAKDIAPIANSPTAFENGANALYDLASAYLGRFKNPLKVYTVSVSKLADTFLVGDTVRVIYKGVASTAVGTRTTWLNIDANLVVLEKTRAFDASGAETWSLKVATVARYLQDDQEIIIGALETLRAFRTGIKFYTFESNHGTERNAIKNGNNFDYIVEYDGNVSYLHKVQLHVQLKGLKSNVTGGTAGGSHSHTVTISSHTHTVSGATSAAAAGTNYQVPSSVHTHVWATQSGSAAAPGFGPLIATAGNGNRVGVYPQDGSSATYATAATGLWATGNVSDVSHTHSVSGQTAAAGGASTPTSSTITDHTHALVYGIFESTVPASPGVQVWINGTNVTTAIGGGGGFGADIDKDISAYMVDAQGHPLRAKNTISLRTTNGIAFDLVVQVRSLIAASAIEAS
jgi:hypothetical protein